jgi:thiamine-phosphate pyrophosphorylase
MYADSPSLYLMTPRLTEASGFAPLLDAALDAGVIACVLARMDTHNEGAAKRIVRTLAPLTQERGAALIVADDVQVAQRAGADGVHISDAGGDHVAALDEAIRRLKPDSIVGAGLLRSKHDAMSAGEKDVDYVMLGEPAPDGDAPVFAHTLERVAWWAEIFNVPVVAHAASLADVAPLARAGADFIALGAAVFDDPRGPASAVRDAMAALALMRRTSA